MLSFVNCSGPDSDRGAWEPRSTRGKVMLEPPKRPARGRILPGMLPRAPVVASRRQAILDEEVMQKIPLHYPVTVALAALLLGGCASTAQATRKAEAPATPEPAKDSKDSKDTSDTKDPNDAYLSTYKPLPSGPVLITNATILTAAGDRIERGSILLQDGRVSAVGNIQAPAGATVVDATGKWVTPGIIDAHSHL